MKNYLDVLKILEESFLSILETQEGKAFVITGESGIGKTYISQIFLNRIKNKSFILNFQGTPSPRSALFGIYKGIYSKIIDSNIISKEKYVSLIKKYSRLIPGFGQYLSPLMDCHEHEAMSEVLARSGLTIGISPSVHIIKFIKEISKDQPVVIWCDDIQWLDSESWHVFTEIVSEIKDLGWLVIFAFNPFIESWNEEHHEIQRVLRKFNLDKKINILKAKRWDKESLPLLCHHLLKGNISFTKEQINVLEKNTKGIPLYVISILESLKDKNNIIFSQDGWISNLDWNSISIHTDLKDDLIERINEVYASHPQSRTPLEIASVIGEQFCDQLISKIKNTSNSFEILSKVEKSFKIIKYLFYERTWEFQNLLIKDIIYNSLGDIATDIHLQIAETLAEQKNVNPLTIAFHFEQGKQEEKANYYKIIEAERLNNIGLFHSSLSIIDQIISYYRNALCKNIEMLEKAELIQGKIFYHLTDYQSAIPIFCKILETTDSASNKAFCNRWLGRCFLKLDSQDDFQTSVNYLMKSRELYKIIGNESDEGDVYTDLVVAYAHMNEFNLSQKAFASAEVCYNKAKDKLGMARLHRRNVIFMDPKLSAPILETIAKTFNQSQIYHEEIMSLNNAATEYIYLGNLEKAKLLLDKALELSVEMGGFGISYIYNNIGIIQVLSEDYEKSIETLRLAKSSSRGRSVVMLIIEINNGAALLGFEGYSVAEPLLKRAYYKAVNIGEYTYIIPALINYAYCLTSQNNVEEAISLLLSHTPEKCESNSYSKYKNHCWYRALLECQAVKRQSDSKLKSVLDKYEYCKVSEPVGIYDSKLSFIDMQFWSD